MKIQKTLKISATQADVEKALIEAISKQDPTIVVDEIIFTPKRGGKDSIAVKIDAHFGDVNEEEELDAEEEETEETSESIPEITDDSEEDEAPFDGDPVDTSSTEEEPVAPKQSLFG